MRTASRSEEDLTARARIRDAAIECFADEGFGASVRTIAARAGVSPGLVTHHFGSKDALRRDCDAHVLRRFRESKHDSVAHPTTHLPLAFARMEHNGPMLVYIMRSIHAGGAAGREFIEHLIDDARGYMTEAVAAGVVKPSRDEEARLRYLTYQSMGALLMEFILDPQGWSAPARTLRTLERSSILPTLELYTEGILATSQMLDAYLAFLDERRSGDGAAGPEPAPSATNREPGPEPGRPTATPVTADAAPTNE